MYNRNNINKKTRYASGSNNSFSNNKEYNSTPSDRFYTLKEEITLRFYQTPKALFKNSKYRGLSLGSKLMYSILRDRLYLSIKNNWKDEKGYIYLIFSIEELASLLEIDRTVVMRYKKKLVEYNLIIDKRIGQGNPNRIYVLKPELSNFLKSQKATSRSRNRQSLEVTKCDPNDTYVNHTNLNNVNKTNGEEVVENSREAKKEKKFEKKEDINDIRKKIRESLEEKDKGSFPELNNLGKENNPEESCFKDNKIVKYPSIKRRSAEKEQLAKEIAKELDDDHSLVAFRGIVDKISEQQIRIFLSIIKDTHLTGKIKKNKGAMFVSLAKAYAGKNNINLNFK
ncbi:MAG: replication initiator protein A [Actinobacteria bacterium]|nr:replication initiator protein A [Actinomycetota bacterium]